MVREPVQRPACSRCPLPTVPAAAAASAERGPPRRLPVGADGRREGVEAHVECDGQRVRHARAAHARAGLHLAVGGEAPRLHGLEHLVRDRVHLEHGVHHLVLLLEPAVLAELATGEPQRQADVHRAFVGADADAGERPESVPGSYALK